MIILSSVHSVKYFNVIKIRFFVLFLFAATLAQAQKLKKEDKLLLANLEQHVHYLSDDKLEGRRTGTEGEKLAAAYISEAFKKEGLLPRGVNEYYQPFEVAEGKQVDPSTFFMIDDNTLVLGKDYFPLSYSADGSIEAMPSLALEEPHMPWFLNLKDLIDSNAGNPHFDLASAVLNRTKEVAAKGASAFIIYNTSSKEDGLQFDGKDHTPPVSIPVIYLNKDVANKFLADPSAALDLRFKTSITEKKRTGTNVIGYIDNGAASTIVLGAHFDHLGYGEDGNSREVEKKHQVHNGADDNASGTAALIELGRLLKNSKLKNNNYLFIAFSGEELGLYGSKYFTQHPTIDLGTVNYMINMDMVGRLSDSTHTMTIGGYGTSPSWGSFYSMKGKHGLYNDGIQFHFDSSGTGPSDHTSFYLKNIPVLFYFTGLHSDYHKPTDDYNKINFVGELTVVKHIYSLLQMSDKLNQRLVFTKTREAQTTTSARFSVTMGIMPDYTFNGVGVRVDGVSDNRPAKKAGLQTGDVITGLGDIKITSLESYMQALSKFKKGDTAKVEYIRGAQPLSTTVEF
jgi:hypothetical protein